MGLDLDLYKIPKKKQNETRDILKRYNDWYNTPENCSVQERCNQNFKYSQELDNICSGYSYFGSNGWFIVHLLKDHGVNVEEIAVEMPQSLVDYLINLKQKLQNMVEQNPELVEMDAFNEFPIDVDNDHIYVVKANW